jgi:hypothetical protein
MPIALKTNFNPDFDSLKLHTCGDYLSNDCDCGCIGKVEQYKYLGVIFNCSMNWSGHVDYLKNKVRKFIYVFRQLNEILNINELKLCYYAYCQSLFMGGIIAWGGGYRSILEPLNVIQKLIIKAALGKGWRYPTNTLFDEFNVLNLRQLYVKTLLCYVFNHSNEIFLNNFDHNYFTRSQQLIRVRVDRLVRTFSVTNSYYTSQIILRNLPPHLQNFQNFKLVTFKKKVTDWVRELGRDAVEAGVASGYR